MSRPGLLRVAAAAALLIVSCGGAAALAGTALAHPKAAVKRASARARTVPAVADSVARRPSIMFYRWQENWSVLANPKVPREPGDALKYIRLSAADPLRYLSFGLTLRERFESNDAPMFGTTGIGHESYLLHRLELHLDAHLTDRTRIFVQFENALAPGLAHKTPVDSNRADIRLALIDTWGRLWGGIYKVRIGRQEMAFDLQRFISVRDGPNVRQAYDAVWGDYEYGPWRLTGFWSQPVQYPNGGAFDDFSNRHLRYGGVRLQRKFAPHSLLSVTFSEYRNDFESFPSGSGRERRTNWDVHYTGSADGFDWDAEGMWQSGHLGGRTVRAWALGTLGGYTFDGVWWHPRFGLQFDAASGDHNLGNNSVGTFNPMFPNGEYLTLSGYFGYVNFYHVKMSATVHPDAKLTFLLAGGGVWRNSIADAVYAQPDIPIPGTAGRPGRFTGDYIQGRMDWAISRSLSAAIEADHFNVSSVIRRAGGHDSDYLGVQMRWGW